MMHTLFAREHNVLVDALQREYPAWLPERVYDTARLIVSALIAKIHTVEWTPAILATETIRVGLRANWYGAPKDWLSQLGIWLLDKKIAPSPLPLLLAAVVIGSWYGGLGPGLLSTGLGVVLALLLYYQPQHPLGVNGAESAAQVLVFTALSIAISWLNEQRRRRGSGNNRFLSRNG